MHDEGNDHDSHQYAEGGPRDRTGVREVIEDGGRDQEEQRLEDPDVPFLQEQGKEAAGVERPGGQRPGDDASLTGVSRSPDGAKEGDEEDRHRQQRPGLDDADDANHVADRMLPEIDETVPLGRARWESESGR